MSTPDPSLALIQEAHPYIGPLMIAALDCLCTAVNMFPGAPLNCCFRVGTEVIHDAGIDRDECCEGLAYVMLGDLYPSSESFPEQDIVRQAQSSCAPAAWGLYLKFGIVRCVPVGDQNPLRCTDYNAMALQNIYDTRSLIHASCCFRNFIVGNDERFLGMSVIIDRQVQGNPLGGCIERSVNIAVQIPNCECG